MRAVPPEVHATVGIVHTKLSLNAQIECQVTSLPQANVHWFHHGIPVLTDHRIGRQDHANTLNESVSEYYTKTKHILLIRNVKENDFGMYDCRAENALGISSSTVELTGRPMPPIFKKSPLVSAFMTHNLIWQTESLSPIYEHKLKFRQVPSGNITPLNRNHPVDWNELIIPADISEGENRYGAPTITQFLMLLLISCRSRSYNWLHAARTDAGQRLRGGGHIAQSLWME